MPAAEPVGPVGDAELSAIFAPVRRAAKIALAVSGGADSLALLLLFERWRGRRKRPDAVVLTVDHRLRKESRGEAATVAAIARAHGLQSRILVWTGDHPRTGIEAAARLARYRLLIAACREEGASHLLLAHHLDDQAETMLLRLARGSGIFGLAAMRPAVAAGDVTILRPLLGLTRARLVQTVALAGIEPVADPMNVDPRFARARIRRIMPLLAADGIDPMALAASARHFAAIADAIDLAATNFVTASVAVDRFAVARLDATAFRDLPREIGLRVLSRLLLGIGGDDFAPRTPKLVGLRDALVDFPGKGRFKRTLAGTVIEWRQGRFHLYRETGRHGLPSVRLKPGMHVIWDGRFDVKAARSARGLRVGALGEDGRLEIGASAGEVASGALAALPAIRRGKRLVSVPSLGYPPGRRPPPATVRPVLAARLQRPPRFPDLPGE